MDLPLTRPALRCAAAGSSLAVTYEVANLALGYPETGTAEMIVSILVAASLPLLCIGVVGLYLAQLPAIGRLGLGGLLTTMTGLVLLAGMYVGDLWIGRAVEAAAPQIFDEPTTMMVIGLVVTYTVVVVGWILLAAATFRARTLSRPASGTFLAGAVIGVAGAIGLPGAHVVLHLGLLALAVTSLSGAGRSTRGTPTDRVAALS